MNWHYEKDGTPMGPVTDVELEAARTSGEIQAMTRIWREGWPDWRTADLVWPETYAPPPSRSLAHPISERCAECGQPHAALVTLGGSLVCPECKPRALEKLREGVPLGVASGLSGPWREGKILVVSRNGDLPDRCFRCAGVPSMRLRKNFAWHHPALYLTIFIGVIIYLILAIIVRKRATVHIPVCTECNARRKRNLAICWIGFALSFACIVIGANSLGSHETLGNTLVATGVFLILFSLIWALCVQFAVVKRISDRFVWVRNAGEKMLDTLPQFPGE